MAGTDVNHPENVALRRTMQRQLPLICFVGFASGLPSAAQTLPVLLVDEEQTKHQFVVALDLEQLHSWNDPTDAVVLGLRRATPIGS
jgi:putative restriction endonuclease